LLGGVAVRRARAVVVSLLVGVVVGISAWYAVSLVMHLVR
jgi:hypothetical protein